MSFRTCGILLFVVSGPAFANAAGSTQPLPSYDRDALQELVEESDVDFVPFPDALFPNGLPSLLTPEAMAASASPWTPARNEAGRLPTRIDLSHRSLKFGLGTKVTANDPNASSSPIPPLLTAPPRAGAGGGAGEVRGQVRYEGDQWELYGAHAYGLSISDSAEPALNNQTVFGSAYKFQDWLPGGRLGASVSIAPEQDPRTRIEYRHSFGSSEAFIAAEGTVSTEHPAQPKYPETLRGGFSRRF